MPHKDEITFDGWVRLPECGFNPPEGHLFAGWMIGGDDQLYAPGDRILANGDIALIAVWERIPVLPDDGDSIISSLPDTGDSSTPMLWLLLCLGACVSMLRLRKRARD